MTEFLKQINWVDLLIVGLIIRIGYVALKTGFAVEIFKFLGTLLAVYLSLHYYTTLGDFLKQRVSVMSLEFLDFLCFLLLAAFGYALFILVRELFGKVVKIEAVPTFSRWAGLVLGVMRGFLVASLCIYGLVISYVNFLHDSAVHSLFGRQVSYFAPNTYSALWNSALSKFIAGEKFNQTVLEIQAEPKKEKP